MEAAKITIREISVNSKGLADSLYSILSSGGDFNQLAQQYSLINPGGGGLYGPFLRKQNRNYYDALSDKKTGDYSSVLSYSNYHSILQLIKKHDAEPLSLKNVYRQIESLLMKEKQSLAKNTGIDGLMKKYTIIEKPSLLY